MKISTGEKAFYKINNIVLLSYRCRVYFRSFILLLLHSAVVRLLKQAKYFMVGLNLHQQLIKY